MLLRTFQTISQAHSQTMLYSSFLYLWPVTYVVGPYLLLLSLQWIRYPKFRQVRDSRAVRNVQMIKCRACVLKRTQPQTKVIEKMEFVMYNAKQRTSQQE